MNANPFDATEGAARDREEALFDFLAEQARAPAPDVWNVLAADAGKPEHAGFCALLLSNLVERAAPASSAALYRVAAALLGDKLSPAAFAVWLSTSKVDVRRLAGHLDHTFTATA
jgi:hypothetical protein